MMKGGALYGILGLTLLAASCQQSGRDQAGGTEADSFCISGNLSDLGAGWVVLSHYDDFGILESDSSQAVADSFHFKGVQPVAALYRLRVPGNPGNGLTLFLGNERVTLEGSMDSVDRARVRGAKEQEVYGTYEALMAPLEKRSDSLNRSYQTAFETGDDGSLEVLDHRAAVLDSLEKAAVVRFVKAHPSSVVSAWAIAGHFHFASEIPRLPDLYSHLKGPALKSTYARQISRAVETARTMVPGKPAPAFSLPDTAGRSVTLKSLSGKYVLINFWASWYGPGSGADLSVKQALLKYHGQGFTVLGISLDKDREAWLKAIRRDHPEGAQVTDLKGWNSAVALRYGVRSLPANILVDPKGVIVARNLMAGRLDGKLKQLFE